MALVINKAKGNINFVIKLTILFLFALLIKSSNNQGDEEENSLQTITKTQFIEYYNNFFKENNPLPEIAELYKENPDYFKLLAAKLVEALPERFPLKMIENIFDKDRIMQAVEEMKNRNITIEEYNKEKRKSVEEALRQKELEELKKKEELQKQQKKEQRIIEGGDFSKR